MAAANNSNELPPLPAEADRGMDVAAVAAEQLPAF